RSRRVSAFRRDHQFVLRIDGGAEIPLGEDGSTEDYYSMLGLGLSPDDSRLLCFQAEPGEQREVVLVESAPRDQLQPREHRVSYPKPGDRLPRPRPRLFDVPSRLAIPVDEAPFADAFSLQVARWAP